jgi:hypothetical protein
VNAVSKKTCTLTQAVDWWNARRGTELPRRRHSLRGEGESRARGRPAGYSAQGDQEDGCRDKGEKNPHRNSVLQTDCLAHSVPHFHSVGSMTRISIQKKYSDVQDAFPAKNKYFLSQDFYKAM